MARVRSLMKAIGLVVVSAACAAEASTPAKAESTNVALSGERLTYLVGCVNCHHQTPKEILNAPSLLIVKTYSLDEFRTLLRTGVTRTGRDMYAQGSIMGIVAREQLSHFTDDEVAAVHAFLQQQWTAERARIEEAKIATFPPPTFTKS